MSVKVTVPEGLVHAGARKDDLFEAVDKRFSVILTFERDPQATLVKLTAGMDVGTNILSAVGEVERIDDAHDGVLTVLMSKNDGSISQYRYNIFGRRISKGTLLAIAIVDQPDDALMQQAVAMALELMGTVVELEPGQLAQEGGELSGQSPMDADDDRSRTGEENALWQALSGEAIRYTINPRDGGTVQKRFNFCSETDARYDYTSHIYLPGYPTEPDKDRIVGTWEVKQGRNGLLLYIRQTDGRVGSWNIRAVGEGRYLINDELYLPVESDCD